MEARSDTDVQIVRLTWFVFVCFMWGGEGVEGVG